MTRALTILNETGDVTITSRSEALAAGARTYFTGLPCSKGHLSERNTSNGMCKTCQADHNQSPEQRIRIGCWAAENPAKLKVYRVRNYQKFADDRRLYARTRYAADPARAQDEQERSRAKNPASVRESRRRSRNKNKAKYLEKSRLWQLANRDKILAFNRNYRARRRAAAGEHTAEDVAEILILQRGRCAYCPTKFVAGIDRHVDHIIALSRGGTNDRRNLQILCQPCNNRKYNHDPIDFAQSIGLLL